MKKINALGSCALFLLLLLGSSCRTAGSEMNSDINPNADIGQKNVVADTYQKLLEVNYETNTTDSGIPGVNGTSATAPDAAYIVPRTGSTGNNYAIAHKVLEGDSAYFSDGNYRSESDAMAVQAAHFHDGDIRRYEFSVLLKDWPLWNANDPIKETNLFQCKITGPPYVPVMIRVVRNTIRTRNPDTSVVDLVPDIAPYINQWLDFRVDVTWSSTNTGNLRYYVKLPGNSDYTLVKEYLNIRTYTGDSPNGQFGYVKWGIYGVPHSGTRIAYHDDIKIFGK